MPTYRVTVPISVEDMDRLCANDSGVSTVIRTALRDQTRTVRLRHGFTSSLTEGEARSFLRYANRQGFERLATALRLISAGKVSSDAEWRTSPCSGSSRQVTSDSPSSRDRFLPNAFAQLIKHHRPGVAPVKRTATTSQNGLVAARTVAALCVTHLHR